MVTPGLQRQHRRHLPVLPSSGRWDVGNPREEGKFAWTGFHCVAGSKGRKNVQAGVGLEAFSWSKS